MEHFYGHLTSESDEINKMLSAQLPISRMTTDETRQIDQANCLNI